LSNPEVSCYDDTLCHVWSSAILPLSFSEACSKWLIRTIAKASRGTSHGTPLTTIWLVKTAKVGAGVLLKVWISLAGRFRASKKVKVTRTRENPTMRYGTPYLQDRLFPPQIARTLNFVISSVKSKVQSRRRRAAPSSPCCSGPSFAPARVM